MELLGVKDALPQEKGLKERHSVLPTAPAKSPMHGEIICLDALVTERFDLRASCKLKKLLQATKVRTAPQQLGALQGNLSPNAA